MEDRTLLIGAIGLAGLALYLTGRSASNNTTQNLLGYGASANPYAMTNMPTSPAMPSGYAGINVHDVLGQHFKSIVGE